MQRPSYPTTAWFGGGTHGVPHGSLPILIASQIAPSMGSGLSQLTSIIPLASSMPIINILDKLMVWIVFVMIYL